MARTRWGVLHRAGRLGHRQIAARPPEAPAIRREDTAAVFEGIGWLQRTIFAINATMNRHLWSVSVGCAAFFLGAPLSAQITETPQTVAPGKVLFEVDGLTLKFDRADAAGNKVSAVGVASTVVTAGLTKSVDVQAGIDLFLRRSVEFQGRRDAHAGLGDLYFRTKWTFWRDPTQGAAIAVMPYIKIPSNSAKMGNDSIEGGVFLPWEMKNDSGVTAGAMLRWDMVRNDDDDGYDSHWHLTGCVRRDLTKRLAVYGEGMLSIFSAGLSRWEGSVGAGALFRLTSNLEFDYEIMRGLNRRATDWLHVFRVNWEW